MTLVMQALTAVLKEQGTSPAAVACHFDHSTLRGGGAILGCNVGLGFSPQGVGRVRG